jgi:CBS domain containing-hemolysin-like protein
MIHRTPSPAAIAALATGAMLAAPRTAHASLFQGETLDKVAEVMSWIVIVVVPVIGIAVFWIVHILPEKIAEKRKHPQAKAIQCLCLLSLFFGGLLWPIAWLWAYSKPVLHKLAYGTDKEDHHEPPKEEKPSAPASAPVKPAEPSPKKEGGHA